MSRLTELLAELRGQVSALEHENPELAADDAAFWGTLEGVSDAVEIADRFAARYQEADTLAEAAEKAAERQQARAKRLRAAAESRKTVMAMVADAVMGQPGPDGKRKPLVRPEYTASFAKGADRLVVSDIYSLPVDYVEFLEPSPKRKDIAAGLKAGEEIPGAEMVPGEPQFRIRFS